MFKKRVSIRDDDDDEIFRGGQTSTKKKSIFWGQPPLRLFFRHLINPSFVRVLLLRTRTKTNAILMVSEDENESESNDKKRSVVARKQPLLHSFLREKVIFSNTDEDDRKTLRKCIQLSVYTKINTQQVLPWPRFGWNTRRDSSNPT